MFVIPIALRTAKTLLSAIVLNHDIAVNFSAFPLKLKNLLSENHKIYMYMYLHAILLLCS